MANLLKEITVQEAGSSITGYAILSNNIKVYPASGRGNATTPNINIESRLQTETNLTISKPKKTYIESISHWADSEPSELIFHINGYYFIVNGLKKQNLPASLKDNPIFASIKYKTTTIAQGQKTKELDTFYSISGVTTSELDTYDQTEQASYFYGLLLTNSDALGNDRLQLTTANNNIDTSQLLPYIASGNETDNSDFDNRTSATSVVLNSYDNNASGKYSLAIGDHTSAIGDAQYVAGRYNIASADYAEIIGGGTNSESKNIRTLDWDGNEVLAGNINITGKADITETLTVEDAVTFGSTLEVTGNTTLNKNLHVVENTTIDGNTVIESTTDASTSSAALKVKGGTSIAKKLNVGGATAIAGKVSITNTTDATSSTGALVISGGARVTKKLNVGTDIVAGGDISINGTANLNGDVTIKNGQILTYQNKELVSLIYPIGSIYMSVNSTDPGTLFPGTTWTAISQGRVLIGAGSNGTTNYTAGSTGGTEKWSIASFNTESTTLTTNQIPSHTHSSGTLKTYNQTLSGSATFIGFHNADYLIYSTSGIFSMTYDAGQSSQSIDDVSASHAREKLNINASHEHGIYGNTGAEGGGQGHTHAVKKLEETTVQPYLVVYMWKRTA